MIQKHIDDSRSLSCLIWTAVPAVRTDYWTDLNIFLQKKKTNKKQSDELWAHDKILYCLKSIYINLYMSAALWCYYNLSVGKEKKYLLWVVLSSKAQTPLKTKAGFYCCILPYCMYEIKGKNYLQTSNILLYFSNMVTVSHISCSLSW